MCVIYFTLCCSGKRNILQIPSLIAYLGCKSIIKGLDIIALWRILKLITSQFECQFKGDSTATHYVELAVLLNTIIQHQSFAHHPKIERTQSYLGRCISVLSWNLGQSELVDHDTCKNMSMVSRRYHIEDP